MTTTLKRPQESSSYGDVKADGGPFEASPSTVASDVFVPFLGLASPTTTGHTAEADPKATAEQHGQHSPDLQPRQGVGFNTTQKGQLQKLRLSTEDVLQQNKDQQCGIHSDQHPSPQHVQGAYAELQEVVHQHKSRQLQTVGLDDDLTELTASNWALQHTSHQNNSGLLSSGLVFAPDPHNNTISSTSTDGSGRSSNSRHMGFFQVQRTDSTGVHDKHMVRPGAPGPAPQPAQTDRSLQGNSTASRDTNGELEPGSREQAWLQFQQVPVRVADSPVLFRSSSSPEPAAKAAQQLLQTTNSDGARAAASFARIPSHSHSATPPAGSRPARASFDSIRSSRPINNSAQPQSALSDLAPAGADDEGPQGLSNDLGPMVSFSKGLSCTPAEARLLLQQQQHPCTSRDRYANTSQPLQPLQPLKAPTVSQQTLPRAASTPPGLLEQLQQQHRVVSRAGSPHASPRARAAIAYEPLAQLDGAFPGPFDGCTCAPGAGMLPASSPRSRSPAPMLTPEAAAAAAAAANSIQQAMAAVDEEMAQLQVLQVLQKRRKWLQANARAAMAQATAAAAASIPPAHNMRPGGTGGVGSTGSNAGNSASTYSSGASSAGTGGGYGWPTMMGWLGDSQQCTRADRQQQQQAHNSVAWESHAGFAHPLPPSRSGSLSPRAAWVSSPEGPQRSTPREVLSRSAGLARSATWSDLPGSSQPQPAPQAVLTRGRPGDNSLSSSGPRNPGFGVGAGGDPHVHNEWQELAGDALQLLELEHALHLLRQA